MSLLTICRCCVSNGVPCRSFVVALIVGVILNLINQGDAVFGGGRLKFTKLILTFALPYCVATYGAVSFRLSLPQNAKPGRETRSLDRPEPGFLRTTNGPRLAPLPREAVSSLDDILAWSEGRIEFSPTPS